MKIDNIKKIGNKYVITFEDKSKLKTYDDVLINNHLIYDKNISSDTLNKINKDTNYYDDYYKTVKFITKKFRSEKEINEYLYESLYKKDIIKDLKQIGLINDLNFAKAYISDKINLSNEGPYKIKKELLEHNIDENVIDEEIEKIDKEIIINKANKLIQKKTTNSKYSGYYLKQKVIADLLNLGYEKELVSELFDNIKIDNISNLKKEYDKCIKKLSSKYSGYELIKRVNNKLYQKGYTKEEIDNI